MRKKSQTTTEMIIIIAVLFILIGIISTFLFDFTSIIPLVEKQSERLYWENTDIQILDHAYKNDSLYLFIANNKNEPIIIQKVFIDDFENNITPIQLVPNQKETINITHDLFTNMYEFLIGFEYTNLQNVSYFFYGSQKIKGVISE